MLFPHVTSPAHTGKRSARLTDTHDPRPHSGRFNGIREDVIMNTIGMSRFKTATIENFTSDTGIKLRRGVNFLFRAVLRHSTKEKVVVDRYPRLEKKEPYIFVSVHGFVNDSVAALSTIDRNAYLLFGTTDTLEHNPIIYAAWANGFIYVNRKEETSRHTAIDKMERVLSSGSSVLIFAEGGFNNTENLLCMKLFSSPYLLAKRTGRKVVPVAPFYEFGSKYIYVNVGGPIDLASYDSKEEALSFLRNALGSLVFENIEKHSTPLRREELSQTPRLDFMRQRCQEYQKTSWTKDVWEEELTQYLDKKDREKNAVEESMDDIIITKENAAIMGPILVKRAEDHKYDFKQYMHENWNKRGEKQT